MYVLGHAKLTACFKMASDGAKCSNYVHSYILNTDQGVNTKPYCVDTQAMVPECRQPLRYSLWLNGKGKTNCRLFLL